MRILVGCEFSGRVRDAFIARGHDAISCDFLESERPGPHIRGNVLNYLNDGWDMLLAFPPCTHLAISGARFWREKTELQYAALEFVRNLMSSSVYYIVIENPVGIISTLIRPPDQIVQPWQYGECASKKTCLWLKNLPPLTPTDIVKPSHYNAAGLPRWDNQTPSGQNKLGPSPERWRERSRTYEGIARAMAAQWG